MGNGDSAGLTRAQGRAFGLGVGLGFLALAAALRFWRHREAAAAVAAALGAVLVLAAFALPARLAPLRRAWLALARLLSMVTTPLVMGIVYFTVITPIALLTRLAGRRPLVHQDRDGSFWLEPTSGKRSDLERQF